MNESLLLNLYARVSTTDQNVKQQIDYLKEYCIRMGHKIGKIVADEESGTLNLDQRKKFKKLLEESLSDESNGILIYRLDRMTRNWYDENFLEKFFVTNWGKCKLLSMSESIDLSNADGKFNFRIMVAIACREPELTYERSQIGIARAKKEGKYKGGKKGRTWAKQKT